MIRATYGLDSRVLGYTTLRLAVGIQLVYALIFWVLLHFLETNRLSADRLLDTLRRRSKRR